MSIIPDAIEPVTGYRFWGVSENKLHAYNSNGGPWEPGENEAICWNLDEGFRRVRQNNPDGTVEIVERDTHGRIPADSCKCGFWLLKEAKRAANEAAGGPLQYLRFALAMAAGTQGRQVQDRRCVVGKVEGYGRVIVGEKGYRCEKARIVELYDIDRTGLLRGDDLTAIAETYGVPVVRREDLDLPKPEDRDATTSAMDWPTASWSTVHGSDVLTNRRIPTNDIASASIAMYDTPMWTDTSTRSLWKRLCHRAWNDPKSYALVVGLVGTAYALVVAVVVAS